MSSESSAGSVEGVHKQAAVLLPLHRDSDGALQVTLVRRSAGGRHGGQLAFPGGNRDPEDVDLRATALREAHEEIGLEPADVDIVCELPPVDTRTTGFQIHPFVGRLRESTGRWRLQAAEIAGVVEVAVDYLAAPDARQERMLSFPSWPEPRMTPVIPLGDDLLWGVTLRILDEALLWLLDSSVEL